MSVTGRRSFPVFCSFLAVCFSFLISLFFSCSSEVEEAKPSLQTISGRAYFSDDSDRVDEFFYDSSGIQILLMKTRILNSGKFEEGEFVAGSFTEADGSFHIKDVPRGFYSVIAFSSESVEGFLKSDVLVLEGEDSVSQDFVFTRASERETESENEDFGVNGTKISPGGSLFLRYRGEFSDSSEIETPSLYDFYFNTTDGSSYIFTGENWVLFSRAGKDGENGIDGKPGEKGEKGDTGEKGEKGEQGIPGEKGEPGLAGADGKDGLDGKNGLDGKDGKDGADGVDGVDGAAGANGKSILWLGSFSGFDDEALKSPEELSAFFDTQSGSSWIFSGGRWNLLAKSGRDSVSIFAFPEILEKSRTNCDVTVKVRLYHRFPLENVFVVKGVFQNSSQVQSCEEKIAVTFLPDSERLSFEVSENGDYALFVSDVDGNCTFEDFSITNIDKTPPRGPDKFSAEYDFSTSSLNFSWENPPENDFSTLKIAVFKDDSDFLPIFEKTASPSQKEVLSIPEVSLDASLYRLEIRALDDLQNESEPKIFSYKNDRGFSVSEINLSRSHIAFGKENEILAFAKIFTYHPEEIVSALENACDGTGAGFSEVAEVTGVAYFFVTEFDGYEETEIALYPAELKADSETGEYSFVSKMLLPALEPLASQSGISKASGKKSGNQRNLSVKLVYGGRSTQISSNLLVTDGPSVKSFFLDSKNYLLSDIENNSDVSLGFGSEHGFGEVAFDFGSQSFSSQKGCALVSVSGENFDLAEEMFVGFREKSAGFHNNDAISYNEMSASAGSSSDVSSSDAFASQRPYAKVNALQSAFPQGEVSFQIPLQLPAEEGEWIAAIVIDGEEKSSFDFTISGKVELFSIKKCDFGLSCAGKTFTTELKGKNFSSLAFEPTRLLASLLNGESLLQATTSISVKDDNTLVLEFTVPESIGEYVIRAAYEESFAAQVFSVKDYSAFGCGKLIFYDGEGGAIPVSPEDFTLSDDGTILENESSSFLLENAIALCFGFSENGIPLALSLHNSYEDGTSGKTAWSSSFAEGAAYKFENLICIPDAALSPCDFEGATDGEESFCEVSRLFPLETETLETIEEYYPTFHYALSYGERFSLPESFRDGWYIPSIKELSDIYQNIAELNDILSSLNFSMLTETSSNCYNSSSQSATSTKVYKFNFKTGKFTAGLKTTSTGVYSLCIRKFY